MDGSSEFFGKAPRKPAIGMVNEGNNRNHWFSRNALLLESSYCLFFVCTTSPNKCQHTRTYNNFIHLFPLKKGYFISTVLLQSRPNRPPWDTNISREGYFVPLQ